MKAFVQVLADGNFPNPNAFEAWRAFNHFGYDVVKFEAGHVTGLPITKKTPCFAGVSTMKTIFKKLKINHTELPSYPDLLNPFLCRNIFEWTVGEVRTSVCRGIPMFAKPIDDHRKMFHGKVFEKELDLVTFGGVPDEWPVLVSNPLPHPIKSEYRAFICDRQVLDVRKYRGSYEFAPSSNAIHSMIGCFGEDAPKAYCLDVGIAINEKGDDYTLLIEVTDAWAFGHYGLDMTLFGRMLIARWDEICGN